MREFYEKGKRPVSEESRQRAILALAELIQKCDQEDTPIEEVVESFQSILSEDGLDFQDPSGKGRLRKVEREFMCWMQLVYGLGLKNMAPTSFLP